MNTAKSYIGDDGRATIRCDQCGRKKAIDAIKFQAFNKQLMVKCACSYAFSVSFEWRKSYRKDVLLSGEYLKNGGEERRGSDTSGEDMHYGNMALENLALGGVAFRTNQSHDLKVGDIIQVEFRLDDPQKSLISRNVIVKRVDGRLVRAEFCDSRPDKALAFYLMA